jgi:hypothetical protein
MIAMRLLPISAALLLGLTTIAAAQMMGPGMMGPGMGPGMGFPGAAPQQRPQEPPCFKDFAPIKAEAERRANALRDLMKKKPAREEACAGIKSFSQAEGNVVRFIVKNADSCGIPQQAVAQMKSNHDRTQKMQNQVCNMAQAGPAKPTGPGLSDALGTTRSTAGSLDPLAPKSGTMDTLTGNVLSR